LCFMTTEVRPGTPEFAKEQKIEIIKSNPPHHVAIILDGNRRYARSHGETVPEGHQDGLENAVRILRTFKELPIETVTLWGFSADNWDRPMEEVDALMEIFASGIEHYLPEVIKDNARVLHLGRKDRFEKRNPKLASALQKAEEITKDNVGQTIVLALDYGGRDHEMRVTERIVEYVLGVRRQDPEISDDQIKGLVRASYTLFFDLAGKIPPADLIFRSSGEQRTSDIGYLNGKQTELATSPKFWPEITEDDMLNALVDFAQRERRMGK